MTIHLEDSASLILHAEWAERRRQALVLADRMEGLGFTRQAKALRCCGRTRRVAVGEPLVAYPCNLRCCPACRSAQVFRHSQRLKPRIDTLVGSGGKCEMLTLTAAISEEPLAVRARNVRKTLARIFRRNAWKGKKGLRQHVGLVVSTEITRGKTGVGHPHLHVLVCGADPVLVDRVAEWLLGAWEKASPGASREAQHRRGADGGDSDWMEGLGYTIKLFGLDLGWDDDFLSEMARWLTNGSHPVTQSGLLRSGRKKPVLAPPLALAEGADGTGFSCSSSGNYEGATA